MINLKSKLKSKKVLFGSWITIPDINIIEIFTSFNFDWLCIDIEHTSISLNQINKLVTLIESKNIIPLVRIGEKNNNLIKRIMDCGAHGIIVADVRSHKEAKDIIDAVKYPPVGKRGVGLYKAQKYGKEFEKYQKWLKNQCFIIPQIEHYESINNLEEIINLKDIDGIMVGPYDLSGSLGKPGKFNDKKYLNCLEKINKIVKKSNKYLGIHSVSSKPEDCNKFINKGYNFIACSLDTIFLMNNIEEYFKKIKR